MIELDDTNTCKLSSPASDFILVFNLVPVFLIIVTVLRIRVLGKSRLKLKSY